ncbi:MAG: CDGSH iron-sulfur domain-containing protein [Bacteroidota bacterium]
MSDTNYSPVPVELEEGKRYSWCSCSHSENQPFCDGSHREQKATPPLVFEAEESKEAWMCTCKQTKNPPYCDGSHNA